MSKVLISNPLTRDWAMVPKAIWRTSLPFAAKGVACYLFGLVDGAMPYVAQIEAETGLGRDARRKAFAALEAAGIIRWEVIRANGRVLGRTLVLCPEALPAARSRHRQPENPALGETGPEPHRQPEIPAVGKPVPRGTETRRSRDGKSGAFLEREDKGRSRADLRSGQARRTAPAAPRHSGEAGALAPVGSVDPSSLTRWQRAKLEAGGSVLVPSGWLRDGAPEAERLRAVLRGLVAHNAPAPACAASGGAGLEGARG